MRTIFTAIFLMVSLQIRAESPQIYSAGGKYLGNLNTNQYNPNSVANPYGQYGNPYGNTINNQFGTYGNPYSPQSVTNQWVTSPKIKLGY